MPPSAPPAATPWLCRRPPPILLKTAGVRFTVRGIAHRTQRLATAFRRLDERALSMVNLPTPQAGGVAMWSTVLANSVVRIVGSSDQILRSKCRIQLRDAAISCRDIFLNTDESDLHVGECACESRKFVFQFCLLKARSAVMDQLGELNSGLHRRNRPRKIHRIGHSITGVMRSARTA